MADATAAEIGTAFTDAVVHWLPVLATVVIGGVVLAVTRHLFRRRRRITGHREAVVHSLVMFSLVIALIIAVALALPIGHTARGHLLTLIGIVLSAAIALSSTTFVGNAMAGLMLRALRNIRPGDFVKVGDVWGRVSEQGLLHTELQTEERNLVTLPNLHLVTNAVEVVRHSGTVVRSEVSIGYDVAREDVERLLLMAARAVELRDPFVRVMALGDFSVSYRVAGILDDVRLLLIRRSALNAAVLDALHSGGVEIVSPVFMNQRQLTADQVMVPKAHRKGRRRRGQIPPEEVAAEAVIFDKADEAEAEARMRQELVALTDQLDELKRAVGAASDDAERVAAEEALAAAEARCAELDAELDAMLEPLAEP